MRTEKYFMAKTGRRFNFYRYLKGKYVVDMSRFCRFICKIVPFRTSKCAKKSKIAYLDVQYMEY